MQIPIHCFENLSPEILLEIFDYLSLPDCIHAFYNLNWNINSTLFSAALAVDLRYISQQAFNDFYKKIIFSNYNHRIRKLKLSNDLTINLLEKFLNDRQLADFQQLRSITLIKPSYMTLGSFALILPDLKQLQHVSIDSTVYPDNFFQLVTTTSPSIKACYLPGLEIHEEITFPSNIECLTITIEDITLLLNLLATFRKLKYLSVSLQLTLDVEEHYLPAISLISCENLQILRLGLSEQSRIRFHEIEYLFQQTLFENLKRFSYNCTTNSLEHADVNNWNRILLTHLSTIEQFHFFLQLPYNAHTLTTINQIVDNLETNLVRSLSFSLSINYVYYIIHTNIYPKTHFDLSFKPFEPADFLNYDPMNCKKSDKFSKVNSLVLHSQALSSLTEVPSNIRHLQVQEQIQNINLEKFLKQCSNELLSLKVFGLPNTLPRMPKLRQLTIQKTMFKQHMVADLTELFPNLEFLTIEIDSISQFGQILNQLQNKTNFTQLRFLRVFSRDCTRTWASWINLTAQSLDKNIYDNITFEIRNLFLFIWL